MRKDRFTIDIPKRWLRRAVVALAVGMLVLPAAAWAGHQFTDVPNSNIFHDDIEWMADNDVTLGCNPNDNPANTEYCPEENVTRQQMAAFLHRMDTEDVFTTPDEVDAMTHFAVVKGTDGSTIAGNGLDSASRSGAGVYTLNFGDDVSECSWTGALGARSGAPIVQDLNLTLNADPANADQIFVRVIDDADVAMDADFNVTVNC